MFTYVYSVYRSARIVKERKERRCAGTETTTLLCCAQAAGRIS